MNAGPHPTTAELDAYARDRLRGDSLECVEQHLLVCHACQDQALRAKLKAGLEPQ